MTTPITDDALALQRLYHWEANAPDKVAFTQPMGGGVVRDYTWREVCDQARRMATHLQGLGVQPGDRVAIISKNTAHWMMSDFAIWLAGAVSVPLYPTLAPTTIAQILEHSGSKVLFVGKLDGWEHMKPGVPAGLPCISHPLSPDDAKKSYPQWDAIVAKAAPLQGHPVRGADDLSTIMYTSGTTGTPKGVMHTFGNFARAVYRGLERIPLNDRSRMLSYLPLSHVVERALVEHGQLATGMRVYFAESLDTFTQDLQRARPTVFFSVPRLWVKFQRGVLHKMPEKKLELFLKIPILSGIVRKKILTALGLDQCQFAAAGAAPMPVELLQWYSRIGLNIAEGYGMTENIGASHITLGDPADFGTVGTPYRDVECRIAPDTGEIQVRCPWTMTGYYKQPELTAETITPDGWLKTGDKGTIDAKNRLRITGRVKDLFKTSKGKYVAPAPIEDKLVMHAAIEACCVTGANLGQPLGLVMLSAEAAQQAATPAGKAELEASLAEHLKAVNATLDPHEQMDCLVVMTEAWTVDNDLITPTFKVKRNKIEDAFAAQYARWESAGKPVVWHTR
ncbi:AMP-binding protein [Azohydromonas sediminis]|uniref:AMP-binding protein n=1 Tax=Azohydromonas sediminis TaxID=2259674 RepID=UPI000E6498E3|nr:AMP-binding protein [Azohydromonas sediminis]